MQFIECKPCMGSGKTETEECKACEGTGTLVAKSHPLVEKAKGCPYCSGEIQESHPRGVVIKKVD